VSYGVGERHPFLGRELGTGREYAESTASRIDAAVAGLLEEARARATDLLREHRATLDALASELVEHEIVIGARLGEIFADTEGSVESQGKLADRAAQRGDAPAAALPAA
jgi:cell division protease FtsH